MSIIKFIANRNRTVTTPFVPTYESKTQVYYDGTFLDDSIASDQILNGDNFECLYYVSFDEGRVDNIPMFGATNDLPNAGGVWLQRQLDGNLKLRTRDSSYNFVTRTTLTPVFATGATGFVMINVRKIGLNFELYVDGVLQSFITVNTIASNMNIDNVQMKVGGATFNEFPSTEFDIGATKKAFMFHNDVLTVSQRADKIAEYEAL